MQLRRFAVIGHPIGHTMSPFIHDRLFSLTGYKPEYSVLDVPSLTQALPALRTLDGFNITIPHKSDIIPLLDGIDEKAKLFGSVNTVRVEDGKLRIHGKEIETGEGRTETAHAAVNGGRGMNG